MSKHKVNITVEDMHMEHQGRVSATFDHFDMAHLTHSFFHQVLKIIAHRIAKLILDKHKEEIMALISIDDVAELVVAEIVADAKKKILQPS